MASASPKARAAEVEEVGTMPYPDSFTSGIYSLIFEALYKVEFFLETIPIKIILFLFAYWIIFFSSFVSPE